jgi:hypothetical protein
MAATTYTGTGSAMSVANTVNGVSFKPDLIWIKQRNSAANHVLGDSVRGVSNYIFSNLTNAEATATAGTGITAFSTNGFTLGTETSTVGSVNASGGTGTYVAWQWNTNGGSSSSNASGSITSTVSAGATQGFSVVTYAGNSTSGATVGHGLGVAPKMIIVKARGTPNGIARSWFVYHASLGATKFIYLDQTSAVQTGSTVWNDTAPSSSVFTLGNENSVNMSANNYVAYCFAEVAGYSKFGSYTGNGATDGPFVYLGFRPRFVLIKSTGLQDWVMLDSSINPYNVTGNYLRPNSSGAENGGSTPTTSTYEDFLSNGIKFRNDASSSGYTNGSGVTYIYAAFAENPFKLSLAR